MSPRTFGTAKLKEGYWSVEAEPHVMARLKRLFPRASSTYGTVKLKDTEEVCRDLEWFSQRFPLRFRPKKRLQESARLFDKRASDLHQLLEGKVETRPFDMALPPREYQRVAAEAALRTGGLLVADDLGLGKTATAIAVLTEPATRPALVVTLTHLPRQWVSELHKFAPSLSVHVIAKGTPYDVTDPRRRGRFRVVEGRLLDGSPAFPDVLVINYHKLAGWADVLAPVIRCVVYDEVQELRRDGSCKAQAARYLSAHADYRLGLSATPIYNYGGEIFNVLDVLRPDALGDRSEFLREWCRGAYYNQDKAQIADPKAFGAYVRETGLMLRRTRADVGRELPALTKVPHEVDADPKALDDVADAASELARLILNRDAPSFDKLKASEELSWRLRQATGIAKAPYVAEFVRLLVESGESVVLYGWHKQVYELWRERLKDLAPAFYTGSQSPTQKENAKKAFLTGASKVLIMSLRAGAGLDGLQGACRTIVFGELDWSPGVHEQCIGRVHRDGQGDPVVAYFLIADTGSDPVVADVLGVKRAQSAGVMDPDARLVQRLGGADVADRVQRLAEAHLRQRGGR